MAQVPACSSSLGFNCFSWRPVLNDGPREMLWADPDFAAGDKRPSSGGIPLLFPFPGRIGGAKYQFNGREYQLEPGDAFGNAIHGFVFNRPWRVVEHGDAHVVGEFQASVDDPTILEHWPADFRIRVSYEVRGRGACERDSLREYGRRPAAVRVRDARLLSAAAHGGRQRRRHDRDGAGHGVLGT